MLDRASGVAGGISVTGVYSTAGVCGVASSVVQENKDPKGSTLMKTGSIKGARLSKKDMMTSNFKKSEILLEHQDLERSRVEKRPVSRMCGVSGDADQDANVSNKRKKYTQRILEFAVTREEKMDLDALKYLLRLIFSHEQYGTDAPGWLVSKEPFDEAATQTKGEYMKSILMSMYRNKQSLYRHTYYQKEDGNGSYGAWILKRPKSYLTSAHAMKRELRANLFSKNYVDCDIENAFPCLLLGLLLLQGHHPDNYKHLWRYVHDRETVLKEIMDEKNCTRGEAKQKVLAIMFKDPTKEWNRLSTFEKSFESEMKANAEKLLDAEKNKNGGIDWVQRSSKKHVGSGLALILQTVCAACLKEGIVELQRYDCHVGALIFDGCLVEKSDDVEMAMVELNKVICKTPEYKFVKFTIKPFKDIVDTSTELPVKFIRNNFNNNATHCPPMPWSMILPDKDVEFETAKQWLIYKRTLVRRLNTRFALVAQGSSFQKTVIMEKVKSKINKDIGQPEFPGYKYVSKSDKDAFTFYKNKTITVTITEIIGKDDRPEAFNKKTGRATFNLLDIWLKNNRNSFSMTDYNPTPLGERGCVNADTFNRFQGYRISEEMAKKAVENGGKADVIIDFIKELCNHNPSDYNFIFQWLACLLQNPAEIPGMMLVLKGGKGIGKSWIYEILKLILGEVNCTSIADMDHLVGKFNDKRKDKKLVVLEEIGSSVYDPKNWGKMKDMITGQMQGFNGKYATIEDSPAPTGFMQVTNDDDAVRVDIIQGLRRIWLVQCNNYWSRQECMVHGRMKEREDKFHKFTGQVFSDEDGCVSAFAHFLYTYPLKKKGDRFIKLEHYDDKCPALHEQAMRSLPIPAQMVLSWIEGCPVWTEETRYSVKEDDNVTAFKKRLEHGHADIDQESWVPRDYVYGEYVRLCKEQKRSKPVSPQVFWADLRKYVDIGIAKDQSLNGKRTRGLIFPSRRNMLAKFKRMLPDYDYDFKVEYDESE